MRGKPVGLLCHREEQQEHQLHWFQFQQQHLLGHCSLLQPLLLKAGQDSPEKKCCMEKNNETFGSRKKTLSFNKPSSDFLSHSCHLPNFFYPHGMARVGRERGIDIAREKNFGVEEKRCPNDWRPWKNGGQGAGWMGSPGPPPASKQNLEKSIFDQNLTHSAPSRAKNPLPSTNK